jgi:hypothetical protein
MSDEQVGNTSYGQEAGTPSEPVQEQTPQYVTVDNFKTLRDEVIEEVKRIAQGLTDKQENRVDRKLKEWEQRLGYTPSPQLREQAKNQLALQELEQVSGGTPSQAASQPIDPIVKDTNRKLLKMLAQYDADFDDLAGIDMNPATNPPGQFLTQVEAKLKSRAPAAPAQQQPVTQPANPTHVPSMGMSGTPIGGTRLEQLTKRLEQIQAMGVQAMNNRALKKERGDIVAELETLGK